MLAAAGIRLIDWYQRFLSPRKGFCCAHRRLHGRASCSQHARRILTRHGFWLLLPLMRRRFDRCRAAALALAASDPPAGDGQGQNTPLHDRMKQLAKEKPGSTPTEHVCCDNPMFCNACEFLPIQALGRVLPCG